MVVAEAVAEAVVTVVEAEVATAVGVVVVATAAAEEAVAVAAEEDEDVADAYITILPCLLAIFAPKRTRIGLFRIFCLVCVNQLRLWPVRALPFTRKAKRITAKERVRWKKDLTTLGTCSPHAKYRRYCLPGSQA